MYKVTCLYDGKVYTLHDPLSNDLRIYNDQLETETNKPGIFKFTVSCDHPYLNKIVGLSSDIRVYDGDEEIWRGRPIDDGEDLYRARTFKCEGELAFLYDSIQPRRELHNVTPTAFFTLLIEAHNAQVENAGPIDKTFHVGVVEVTDDNNSLYRYTNRETTLDCIGDKIINRLGGYLSIRKEGNDRYIDLKADVETISDQPIQFGENLLNYAKDTDYTQVATACIPLGKALEESEIPALNAYLTCEAANDGSDTIQIDAAVERYGFICKVLNFDDITVASNLKSAGTKWLTDGQYEQMTLTLTALDLHTLGYNLQPLRINTQVRCLSTPHGMDRYFEVSKRTYHLTLPESDTVTFGKSETKKSYTSSNYNQTQAVKKHADQIRRTIDTVIDQERDNISDILNQATHGYVVMDPNDGPERILIMDTDSTESAMKIWKWDMNGLGYSSSGINGPWSTAITMNGEISADFIVTGALNAALLTVGTIADAGGYNYWNLETGEIQMAALDTIISTTDVQYGNSDSASTPPSTWTTDASWERGKYLWTRTKLVQSDGIIKYTTPRVLANGNGLGVSKVTEQYYLSTSNSTQTGGSWSETQPTWVTGCYYWTRSKIEWADGTTTYSDPVLASALTSGNQSTDNLDTSLDQQSVFNRLTNNGQTQGIYLSNSELYINASYIATGILADANNNTTFNLSDGTLTMNKGSININNGAFQVTTQGALTATSASIKGTLFSGTERAFWIKTDAQGRMVGGYDTDERGFIDFSASLQDPESSSPSDYVYGLKARANAINLISDIIAVTDITGGQQGQDFLGGTGTVYYVDQIPQTNTFQRRTLQFINGIMVTDIS